MIWFVSVIELSPPPIHIYCLFGNRERRVTEVYRVVHRVFLFFRLAKTENMVDRPLYSMFLYHRRSFFPIRVYNHRLDYANENPPGRATYVIDIPDDGTLSPLGVGWSRYEARGRQQRTNGWKVPTRLFRKTSTFNKSN